jgi:hypothetical protein
LWRAVAAAGEASSKLCVFPGFWSLFLHKLLRATDVGFRF